MKVCIFHNQKMHVYLIGGDDISVIVVFNTGVTGVKSIMVDELAQLTKCEFKRLKLQEIFQNRNLLLWRLNQQKKVPKSFPSQGWEYNQ